MSLNQDTILNFIKVNGGVVNLRELSHFNRRDIEALWWKKQIKVWRGKSGIEVELLNDNTVQSKDEQIIKEELKKHHQYIEEKLIKKKREASELSLKSKIISAIQIANTPLNVQGIKELIPGANNSSISSYLFVLKKEGVVVCTEDKKTNRYYTTPDKKQLLIDFNKKPKTPKPQPIPVPVTAATLKAKLAAVEGTNLKYKVLEIIINSQSPLTLQQVRSLLPQFNGKTISAYLSMFTRQGILCCSRITKNNIRYYTTPDQSHLLQGWTPKFGSQKVTARILNVLENTTIALGVNGIVAQAQVSRKSAWATIHKLKNKGLIELKQTGYSLQIALITNESAMETLGKISGYTLKDQVIESIKRNNHHAEGILKDLINDYSLPHIHRVLRDMKADGVLYSRNEGRYTLYFLSK